MDDSDSLEPEDLKTAKIFKIEVGANPQNVKKLKSKAVASWVILKI